MPTHNNPYWPADPLLSKEWTKKTLRHNASRQELDLWPSWRPLPDLAADVEAAIRQLRADLFNLAGYILWSPNVRDCNGVPLELLARDALFERVKDKSWPPTPSISTTLNLPNSDTRTNGTTLADLVQHSLDEQEFAVGGRSSELLAHADSTTITDTSRTNELDSPSGLDQESTESKAERTYWEIFAETGMIPSRRKVRKRSGGANNVVNAVCTRLAKSDRLAQERLIVAVTKSLYNCIGEEKEGRGGDCLPVLDHSFDPYRDCVNFATRKIFAMAGNHPVAFLGITPQNNQDPQLKQARRGHEEEAYIALAVYSRLLASELIAGIGRHTGLDQIEYVYANEVQDDGDRLLHWQSFALLPPHSLSEDSLPAIAHDALVAVYEKAVATITPNLPATFVDDFTVYVNPRWNFRPDFKNTYLAKEAQKAPRALKSLRGTRISPFNWAGSSIDFAQAETKLGTTAIYQRRRRP